MSDTLQMHANQVEYWNGAGGERWIANQTRRDKMLGDFGVAALAAAAAQPGESVIDIGCGCGETSADLASSVGPAGKVLAADVSAPILAMAAERLSAYPQAQAVVADASVFPFEPASADLLFSRFGVMFFGDPTAAFANLRKALKPTGRMVFACWRTPKENPWMTASLEAVYQHVERPPPPSPDEPGPFSFNNPERVTAIVTAAGFSAPSFEKFDPMMDVSAGNGVEGAVQTALEFGPVARVIADQDAEMTAKITASVREFYTPLLEDGRIMMPAAIWIVSAKPV